MSFLSVMEFSILFLNFFSRQEDSSSFFCRKLELKYEYKYSSTVVLYWYGRTAMPTILSIFEFLKIQLEYMLI